MIPRSPIHRFLSRLRVARLDCDRPWQLPEEDYARREAVMWAHRLLLGREPASAAALEALASSVRDTSDLRNRLMGGSESPDALAARWDLPPTAEGRREAARWAYRTILLREPESVQALAFLADHAASARQMRDTLLQSAEVRSQPGFPVSFSMTGDEPAQEVQVEVDRQGAQRLFDRVQATWRALGEERPHWSVITSEDFGPERIGDTIGDFYATGERNVETLLRTLARNGVDLARIRRCMDFGCGVGRLTVALAGRFPEVIGVDVSASHLAIAREAFARRGLSNATTRLLETVAGIGELPHVDLVYSIIVLQHNPPPVMRALFEGLLRCLEPGGVAVIQVPTYLPVGYRFELAAYEKEHAGEIEMHALPQREVFALAKACDVDVLEVIEDAWTGYGTGSRSNTFVMQRSPSTRRVPR
jgi:SAM-dependent methyltransferase